MTINTRQYELAHGKRPKGWGWWSFDVRMIDGATRWYDYTGTLSNALKSLRALSMAANAVEAVVLP